LRGYTPLKEIKIKPFKIDEEVCEKGDLKENLHVQELNNIMN